MYTRQFKRSILFITAFASFCTPFMGAAINLALPAIGKDLDANAIQLNWVVSIYLLTTAVFMLPFGRLGDIMGRKKVFMYGLVMFTLTTSAITFSKSIGYFLFFRSLQGLSSAMIFGNSMAIITSVFPPGERGKAMGINITAVYAGLSSGPFLGGLLTEYFGWRSIFIVLIPIGATAAFLTFHKIRVEWAEANSEKRIKFPLLYINLLRSNRVFSYSNLAAMIHYSATSAIGFFLSLYLQYLKGLDARTAGFILMTQPVMMTIFSIPAGKLSDRINPGYIASLGIGMTAIGIFALTFIQQSTSLFYIISILAFNGFGYALFSTPNSNAIMSSVEKRHLGVASGMLGTMRMVGQTMSLGIAMLLIALFIGKEKISPDTYPALLKTIRTGLLIFAIICIPAVFASLARNKKLNSIINYDK